MLNERRASDEGEPRYEVETRVDGRADVGLDIGSGVGVEAKYVDHFPLIGSG